MTSFLNLKAWLAARRKMVQGLLAMSGMVATSGVGLPHQAQLVVQAIIAVLGVYGVHAVANEPLSPPAPPAL